MAVATAPRRLVPLPTGGIAKRPTVGRRDAAAAEARSRS